jgi:aspartyl-tRNA(Asn)/glutamyl-tRNA(Gln) amidotransferase subunit A
MLSSDLCYLSITEAAALIRRKEVSPVELVDAHLQRIERLDRRLNSFVTVVGDEARAAARHAERAIHRGEALGPLHGLPIGLKDLYFTRGLRTTMGSKIMADFVPDFDAGVVDRLRQAGAVVIGKQQMHEFALGGTSENPHWGPARNPWDPERMTGGSSGGGGSAVAAGLCIAALGTDTGGSIRIPSSLCGVVGAKPTFGRVSRYGVFPLSWSMDTAGPLTRSVRDAAILLRTIAGHDSRDPSSAELPTEDFERALGDEIRGVRIGIPQQYFFDDLDPEVESAVHRAARLCEQLGAIVESVSIPVFEQAMAIFSPILLAEAATIHLDNLRLRPTDFDPEVRARLEMGALTPAPAYLQAQRARSLYNRKIGEAMERFDLLLTPTTPTPAPRIEEKVVAVGGKSEPPLSLLPRLTRPFNLCGLPTVSVPCGFTFGGLPIGLQLTGRIYDDSTVLRAAHVYEQATEWHRSRPPLDQSIGASPSR